MILIFSESNDISTSQVIEWLLANGQTVLRLNECDKLLHFTLQKEKTEMIFSQLSTQQCISICLSDIDAVWYRKGGFSLQHWLHQQFSDGAINKYVQRELRAAVDYIYYLLGRKKMLATIFTSSMNKLHVNLLAEESGLLTPRFIISTQKEKLENFLSAADDNCITKAISETFYIAYKDSFIISYTEDARMEDLKDYSCCVSPTLLQQKIDKKYELRIFYLNGVCYASAIFSQNDAQTKTDFRKYNYIKPNRTVPFSLPAEIAEKLHVLMQQLQLKTGSIDMLVTKNNEYIFLEVNPVGQFGMVSFPCNYFLEEKIAAFLTAEAA